MIDSSMTLAAFGRDYLAGKSAKTAKRIVLRERIQYHIASGHWLIKQSDAEAWRDARLKTPAAPDLRSLLRNISEETLQKRNRGAA